MADCPNCGESHTFEELTVTKTYSTYDTTYAYLKCPSCEVASDYSDWDAFSAIFE